MTHVHDDRVIAAAIPDGSPARVMARRLAAAGLGVEITRHRDTCELTILGAASGNPS